MSVNQGQRRRARDSRGRAVPNLYIRDGRYSVGWMENGKWRMRTLDATTITEAKRERDSVLAGSREGRIAAKDGTTFGALFEEWQGARSISPRTKAHERHLLNRHLDTLKDRRVQDVDARDLATILRSMRAKYSPWTMTAVYRIVVGTFKLGVRRGVLVRSPADGLVDTEKPSQKNKKQIARLDSEKMNTLVAAGTSERWRAALGLAGYGGLRLGEVRGLKWQDVDFDADVIRVSRSLLPDGSEKATKSEAGKRPVILFPELRLVLRKWQIRSPYTAPDNYVISAIEGAPVMERNLRRALAAAKKAAGIDGGEKRLSWHALRHSAGSIWLTEYRLADTTVSAMMGHSNPAFTLKCYGRDPRDEQAIVADVLARVRAANGG